VKDKKFMVMCTILKVIKKYITCKVPNITDQYKDEMEAKTTKTKALKLEILGCNKITLVSTCKLYKTFNKQ